MPLFNGLCNELSLNLRTQRGIAQESRGLVAVQPMFDTTLKNIARSLRLFCLICSERNLDWHMKVAHKSTGNFKCRYCSKRFLHENYKKAHEKLHTGTSKYKCRICGEYLDLLRLYNSVVIDAGLYLKSFKCISLTLQRSTQKTHEDHPVWYFL